jgi:spore coat polysaccharide biosynthesis protein SpsF (cytidylyltransferase family)
MGMVKTGAIIQARMASSRLPEKVVKIMPNGLSVIETIVSRISSIPGLDEVIVAIPEENRNSALYECAARSGAAVFCGSGDDVLDRYYHCAKAYELDAILRVTADDPFRDPEVESAVLQVLLSEDKIDYVKSVGLPEGINAEAVRMRALTKAYHEAKLQSEREHVLPYIWKQPELFCLKKIEYPRQWEHFRLTLDMDIDWQVVAAIDTALYRQGRIYTTKEIMSFLALYPELVGLNSHIEYNAGYKKSVANDKSL